MTRNLFKQLLAVLLLGGLSASADLPPPEVIDLEKIKEWLITIGNYLISGSVILAVIVIVLSGVRWMTASDPKKAKDMLISGIIGTAIILGVGLIIKTVASLVGGEFFD